MHPDSIKLLQSSMSSIATGFDGFAEKERRRRAGGTHTTICLRPRRGLRINLRVRRVTGVSVSAIFAIKMSRVAGGLNRDRVDECDGGREFSLWRPWCLAGTLLWLGWVEPSEILTVACLQLCASPNVAGASGQICGAS